MVPSSFTTTNGFDVASMIERNSQSGTRKGDPLSSLELGVSISLMPSLPLTVSPTRPVVTL